VRRREWVLTYDFRFRFNCSWADRERQERFGELGVKDDLGSGYFARDLISFFVVDNDDEEVEEEADDLLDALGSALSDPNEETCPVGLAAIRMKGSLDSDGATPLSNGEDAPCAVLEGDPDALRPDPQPCKARPRPEDDLVSKVQSQMLVAARCMSGSWPAETLRVPCEHEMRDGSDDDEGAAPTLAVSLQAVCLGALVWAMVVGFIIKDV